MNFIAERLRRTTIRLLDRRQPIIQRYGVLRTHTAVNQLRKSSRTASQIDLRAATPPAVGSCECFELLFI
jgi:hypothetical protein